MKKKATVKRKAVKKKSVKKGPTCQYCGAAVSKYMKTCSNCISKKKLIHKLWLIGQKILADAGRLNNNETED